MDPNLTKALLVLFVGMFTVFVILLLVVLSGKTLILIINRFFPLPEKEVKQNKIIPLNASTPIGIQPKQLAAIVAAVDIVTGGKGKITSVEKQDI